MRTALAADLVLGNDDLDRRGIVRARDRVAQDAERADDAADLPSEPWRVARVADHRLAARRLALRLDAHHVSVRVLHDLRVWLVQHVRRAVHRTTRTQTAKR